MATFRVVLSTVLFSLVASACGSDSGPPFGSTGADGTGDTAPNCAEGTIYCDCAADRFCDEGLVCDPEHQICIPESGMTGGDGDGATGGGGTDATGTAGTSGPTSCMANEDCSYFAVCLEGQCVHAHESCYRIGATYFSPASGCSEGGLSGDKELYFTVVWNGARIGKSGWEQGECPGFWSESFLATPAPDGVNGDDKFWLRVWDSEFDSVDNYITGSHCWGDPCGSDLPPLHVLHDGIFDGTTSDGSTATIEFSPAPCE